MCVPTDERDKKHDIGVCDAVCGYRRRRPIRRIACIRACVFVTRCGSQMRNTQVGCRSSPDDRGGEKCWLFSHLQHNGKGASRADTTSHKFLHVLFCSLATAAPMVIQFFLLLLVLVSMTVSASEIETACRCC